MHGFWKEMESNMILNKLSMDQRMSVIPTFFLLIYTLLSLLPMKRD